MTNFFRLKHSDPDFHRLFQRNNIDGYSVYARDHALIGQVHDTWIDEAGRYYLVVDRDADRNAGRVLVPLGGFQIDYHGHQIQTELDSAQIVGLPIVTDQGIVRATGPQTAANQTIATPTVTQAAGGTVADTTATMRTYAPLEASAPLEGSAPLDVPHVDKEVQRVVMPDPIAAVPAPVAQPIEQPRIAPAPAAEVLASLVQPAPVKTPVRIVQEEKIRLLEERLVVNARKQKIGDVIMRKEVITEMVQVPIRREKLIVEQISPQRRQLVEVDLSQGDRTIELLESLSDSYTGSNGASVAQPIASGSTNGQGSLMSIQAASQLLAELANHPEYQGSNVRIEFIDPRLQTEYQRRSQPSSI